MATRISGLTSGLDTEALVSAMVSGYKAKVTKSKQAQQSLQYKKDALKSINSDVYNLFSSVDKLRWSSAYSLKSTTVSDSTKAKVKASDSSVNGTQKLEIKELAQAGYLTGGNVKGETALTGKTKLSDIYTFTGGNKNSFAGGAVSVSVAGKETSIALTPDMTAQDFVNKLKDAGLNANFDAANGRFFISSKTSGEENDFTLVAKDADGLSSLKALGLYAIDAGTIAEYQKWADYANLSSAEWESFVDEQYKSQTITYEARANSYASAFNSALAQVKSYNKSMNDLLDTFKDSDGNRIINNSAEAKAKADELLSIRDSAASPYAAYVKLNPDGTQMHDEDGALVYDTEAMKAADADLYSQFEKDTAEIKRYRNAEKKLKDFETKISENQAKMDELETGNKVNVERDTNGDVVKAIALTSADGSKWDALVSEVNTDNQNARDALSVELRNRVNSSIAMLSQMNVGEVSEGAVRLSGSNAKINLNGAEFISQSNNFSINGLSIEATAKTEGAITVTTATDTQGLYDKIKDFLQQYNEVVNKISKLYNAESAKGYDPLTDEQKEKMSETEINKWETKVKNSILRRDDTLSGILNTMAGSMAKVFEVDGKNYGLSTFGIKTLGYFSSKNNDKYAYHIDGDADDKATAGNNDKLMAAIVADPEKVTGFFQKLSTSLYDSLNKKMKSTSLSSAYTIYNDKKMESEYKDYSKIIKKWEKKTAEMEDYYYKKFASMEKTLSKLQSSTSSLSSFFGK